MKQRTGIMDKIAFISRYLTACEKYFNDDSISNGKYNAEKDKTLNEFLHPQFKYFANNQFVLQGIPEAKQAFSQISQDVGHYQIKIKPDLSMANNDMCVIVMELLTQKLGPLIFVTFAKFDDGKIIEMHDVYNLQGEATTVMID
jgi:hypothetical protein